MGYKKGKAIRLVFAGTSSDSVIMLQSLIDSNYNVIAIITSADKKKGRGQKIQESELKSLAVKNNLELFTPSFLRNNKDIYVKLKSLNIDLIIVFSYGLILPEPLLNIPKYGCINIHTSLLPKWRGAAPIQRAIEAGDKVTGITIIKMDIGLDTGNILSQKSIGINKNHNNISLREELINLSIPMLYDVIEKIASNIFFSEQQFGYPTYATKISKDEGLINFKYTAVEIERKVRAFIPWPGTFIKINNELIKIIHAIVIEGNHTKIVGKVLSINNDGIDIQTTKNIIRIKILQFPGKKVVKVKDLLNGRSLEFLKDKIL